MPYKCEWDSKYSFTAEFTGRVSLEEIMSCDTFFEGNEYLDSARVTLWDFSAMEDFDLSRDDIEAIVVIDRITSSMNNKITVLLVLKEEHYKHGELYQFYAKDLNWSIEIFTERSEADRSKLRLLRACSKSEVNDKKV